MALIAPPCKYLMDPVSFVITMPKISSKILVREISHIVLEVLYMLWILQHFLIAILVMRLVIPKNAKLDSCSGNHVIL